MFRYTALVWSEDSELEKAAAEMLSRQMVADSLPWSMALDLPGLRVYCTGIRKSSSNVYLMPDGSGLVLGTLFRRQGGDSAARPSLSMKETRGIHTSAGK